jgi:hypothetical protein
LAPARARPARRTRKILAVYLIAAVGAGLVAIPVARAIMSARRAVAGPVASTAAPGGLTLSPSAPAGSPPAGPSAAGSSPTGRLQTLGQPSPPPQTIRAPADPAAVQGPGYLTFFGWTLVDRRNGALTGSTNRDSATNTTESMIKVWLAADYLRRQSATPGASTLDELTRMIVNSDDNLAYKYFKQDGGDAAIRELASVCDLHNTRTGLPDKWSYTMMSPADAARMGLCVATGRAAGPRWTDWLLTTMRNVKGGVADQQRTTGGGRWGIIDALPEHLVSLTSIKNGWTAQPYDHQWHVNCLAIHPDWILAIEVRFRWTSPDDNWLHANNLQQGADACATVTRQLLTPADL